MADRFPDAGRGDVATPTLTAEEWQRVAAIFDDAVELAEPERTALIASRCGNDVVLRTEVESLLRSAAHSDGFLDPAARDFSTRWLDATPAAEGDGPSNDPGAPAGTRFGPFEVVRELGYGGMGAVYLAERADPQLHQRVAIKLVRDALRSRLIVQRFLEERQLLAVLDHPAIARLVDGGITDEGVPWFAMEYVDGVPLDRFCDERGLDVAARLALFCRVCDAVQYAHGRLVVHCDLKPTNILVTADGQPKLLDFGVARLVGSSPAAEAAASARLVTPAYASPEQIRGESVSTASDVFSLGVVLYRLLAGTLPFRDRDGVPATSVCRPSDAVGRGTRLQRRLRGDLDAIVLKALHVQPALRYAGAGQLADDLRRHLALRTVNARADTAAYRTARFVARNRIGVSLAALATSLLIAFAAVTAVQANHIAIERDRAHHVESFLVDLLHRADPYTGNGDALTVREMLDRGTAQLAATAVGPEVQTRLYFALGKAYRGLGEYDRAIDLLDSAHVLLRRQHGERHPETISAANLLADVLRFAGRYDASRELYAVVLAARREQDGDLSPTVARSMNGLAMVLRMQGRHDEAEALLRHALVIDRAHVDTEPAALTQTLNNLGHVMREQGSLDEAEALHRESLAARITLWGPEHFEVSVSLSNLAGVLRDRGALHEADSVYRNALALRRRMVGEQHPDLAADRAGYARLLHLRGDLATAEPLYRQALAVQRRALPEGHPVLATTLVGLGRVLTDRGEAAAAEPLLREALAIRERVLPPGHRLIVEAREALSAAGSPRVTH